jgi:hypothetical protein
MDIERCSEDPARLSAFQSFGRSDRRVPDRLRSQLSGGECISLRSPPPFLFGLGLLLPCAVHTATRFLA